MRIDREGMSRDRLARRVELEQLLRHVAHGFLDLGLGAFPRRAAKTIDRWSGRAGVLLNEIEPLDRDKQLVFTGITQLEEFLNAVSNPDLLQPDEHANPVVDVNNEVPDFEVP